MAACAALRLPGVAPVNKMREHGIIINRGYYSSDLMARGFFVFCLGAMIHSPGYRCRSHHHMAAESRAILAMLARFTENYFYAGTYLAQVVRTYEI